MDNIDIIWQKIQNEFEMEEEKFKENPTLQLAHKALFFEEFKEAIFVEEMIDEGDNIAHLLNNPKILNDIYELYIYGHYTYWDMIVDTVRDYLDDIKTMYKDEKIIPAIIIKEN